MAHKTEILNLRPRDHFPNTTRCRIAGRCIFLGRKCIDFIRYLKESVIRHPSPNRKP